MRVFAMPHPSPMFVNRASGNTERILTVLLEMTAFIGRRD